MTGQLFSNKGGPSPRCHTKHEELKLGNGVIVGASCGSPREGYDIYIGFCYTMKFKHQKYPWQLNGKDPVIEFQYNITDGCAPGKPKEFKKMIQWVIEQLDAGKRIHVGCIGGHGRTGTFLAALVARMKIDPDPIAWVRKHHCQKAVESESQVKFLVKHFGCKTAKPSKPSYSGTATGRMYHHEKHWEEYPKGSGYRKPKKGKVVAMDSARRISPMAGRGSIWGD